MILCMEEYTFFVFLLGMAIGRVISGTRHALPLMGRDIIFLNGYGTGLGFF